MDNSHPILCFLYSGPAIHKIVMKQACDFSLWVFMLKRYCFCFLFCFSCSALFFLSCWPEIHPITLDPPGNFNLSHIILTLVIFLCGSQSLLSHTLVVYYVFDWRFYALAIAPMPVHYVTWIFPELDWNIIKLKFYCSSCCAVCCLRGNDQFFVVPFLFLDVLRS